MFKLILSHLGYIINQTEVTTVLI